MASSEPHTLSSPFLFRCPRFPPKAVILISQAPFTGASKGVEADLRTEKMEYLQAESAVAIPLVHLSLSMLSWLSWDSLCESGWPQFRDLPAPASQVLGLKVCLTTPRHFHHILWQGVDVYFLSRTHVLKPGTYAQVFKDRELWLQCVMGHQIRDFSRQMSISSEG